MKYIAGFIGVGNMGGALLTAVCNAVDGENVSLYDISINKAEAVSKITGATFLDVESVAQNSKYLFLGVKPNMINDVVTGLKGSITKDTVLVSMAAGVSIEAISKVLGSDKIIRIMPNTPVSAGEGMVLYCTGKDVTGRDVSGFEDIMKDAGTLDKIDEKLIDAAAALSGCGPAFVYMFIDALADGAVKCGLPRDKALCYAKQTVLGSAAYSKISDKHPDQLKDEVCSPGGTTIEGVIALERGSFRHTVSDAVISAYNKTSKLIK